MDERQTQQLRDFLTELRDRAIKAGHAEAEDMYEKGRWNGYAAMAGQTLRKLAELTAPKEAVSTLFERLGQEAIENRAAMERMVDGA